MSNVCFECAHVMLALRGFGMKSELELQCLKSLKRTNDLFLSNVNLPVPNDPVAHKTKIGAKIVGSEFAHVKDMKATNANNKVPEKEAFVTDEDDNENASEPPLKRTKLVEGDVKGFYCYLLSHKLFILFLLVIITKSPFHFN